MLLGMNGGVSAALFEKSAHRLVESPVKRAFLKHNSGTPFLHTSFSRCIMIGCIHPRSNRGRRRSHQRVFGDGDRQRRISLLPELIHFLMKAKVPFRPIIFPELSRLVRLPHLFIRVFLGGLDQLVPFGNVD